jgi:tRNA isopentenyl-2-thiomethyl-A-37 hydroxylase MiaE
MKTERVTLLTSPEFKAFLATESKREKVSVAELVRSRCERRPTQDEATLIALTAELRSAVSRAKKSLREGLSEADKVLAELRARRTPTPDVPKRRRAKAVR